MPDRCPAQMPPDELRRIYPEYCSGCTRPPGHDGPHRCIHGSWPKGADDE